jgi:hypothetical protein
MSWPATLGTFLTGTARGKGDETGALNDAALFAAMRRAGAIHAPTDAVPVPEAPVDTLPPADAASEVLRRCLDESAVLVQEWCEAAARAGVRVPDARLPEFLTYAARHPGLREAIGSVLGARGQWLARHNPDWAKLVALPEEIDLDEIRRRWEEGTQAQRREVLSLLTQRDPALRRELIESSWKQEPAKNRVEFVEAFAEGVFPEDEEFLVACLADRSMDVRYNAAIALGLLPESATAAEIYGLAREFVRIGTEIRVNTPPADDIRFDRYGIASIKGPARPDQKLARLNRLVGLVPPWRWEASGERPSTLLGRFPTDNQGQAFVNGVAEATRIHKDAGWAEALFHLPSRNYGSDDLVELLPRVKQELLARKLWDATDQYSVYRFYRLALTDHVWSTDFTRWFIDTIARETKEKKPRMNAYYLRTAALSMNLDVASIPNIAGDEAWQGLFEEWRRVLDLRRSIHSTLPRREKP